MTPSRACRSRYQALPFEGEMGGMSVSGGLVTAEVSFLLGFSEPSAFHRAFKRWTERTPAQWRSERLA